MTSVNLINTEWRAQKRSCETGNHSFSGNSEVASTFATFRHWAKEAPEIQGYQSSPPLARSWRKRSRPSVEQHYIYYKRI